MGVASYQQPNDHNLVKEIRPFEMPYNALAQEISTKNQYWKMGADRMKSIYDQAVGLDPQFAQNKEYLKNFMSQANEQLTKISKSDLSVLDNSQQAVNVFKPLYDTNNKFNYRLLEDSQINSFYKQQQQLSDTYRTKDGGKEWNQNNDFYFRDAQQKYLDDAKNGNLDSIDSHYQNRKSYIPYYDYKKEITDLQEACKGYSTDSKDISQNELYFQERSKKGCSPSELALAFQTGLSDRARQQMQIDGYTYFKGNEDELSRQFTNSAIIIPQKQVDALKAIVIGLEVGGVQPEEKENYELAKSKLAILEPQLKDAIDEFDKMTKGNTLEYVKNNYDKLSGLTHFRNLTNNLATAFRTDEEKNIASTNPAGMLKLRLETERTNMYIQDDMDRKIEDLKNYYKLGQIEAEGNKDIRVAAAKGELVSGNGELLKPANPVTSENKSPTEITEEEWKKTKLEPQLKVTNDAKAVLSDYIGKALKKDNPSDDEIQEYIKIQQDKKDKGNQYDQNSLNSFKDYKDATASLGRLNDELASVNATIKTKHPDLLDDSKFSDEKVQDTFAITPQVSRYTTLSEKDMFHILNGESINGFTYGVRQVGSFGGGTGGGTYTTSPVPTLFFNGTVIVSTTTDKKIGNLFHNVLNKVGENLDKVQSLRNKMFTDNYYKTQGFTQFNTSDFGKKNAFEDKYNDKFKQLFNTKGGLGDPFGYQILFRDNVGSGVYVQLLDKNAKPESYNSDVLAKLRTQTEFGYGVEKKAVGNGYAYFVPDVLPRDPNLPDAKTLQKHNEVKQHINFIEQALQANSEFINPNKAVIDSKELPTGGSTTFTNNFGQDFTISIKREQGKPLKYVASYLNTATNQPVEKDFPDINILLSTIDSQIK